MPRHISKAMQMVGRYYVQYFNKTYNRYLDKESGDGE